MLEVRKNVFTRSYENLFFRELAKHLSKSFKERNIDGLLLGSPFCTVDDRLQIDALLVTKKVVCIIDFKNYSGKIKLPGHGNFEFGLWSNATNDTVAGGSTRNPFIQLKNQKRKFGEVTRKYIIPNLKTGCKFEPNHVVRIVCFQHEIELDGSIPKNEALNFFIFDKRTIVPGMLDIIDVDGKETDIPKSSYDAFKEFFLADSFNQDENPFEDGLRDFREAASLNYQNLYPDQDAALNEIKLFLSQDDKRAFVLHGTSNSGKTHLIPFIQDIAFKLGIHETVVFAPFARAANNLMGQSGITSIQSIYSYIFGGQKLKKEVDNAETRELDAKEEDLEEVLELEQVPLLESDDADNAVFIVDECQLLSDSRHQSVDLIFGSGHLLRDFLSFANWTNTKRKIIFIGDPYLLNIGSSEESPLNPNYLRETYQLNVEVFQLMDKSEKSSITEEALRAVNSIRLSSLHSLSIQTGTAVENLQRELALQVCTRMIQARRGHLLTFKNEKAQEVNAWIKSKIIRNAASLDVGDLLIFNNNVTLNDDDPFTTPQKIYNGEFADVLELPDVPEEFAIKTKSGSETILTFLNIRVKLRRSGEIVTITSFENYRNNADGKLSMPEIVAYKILVNREIAAFIAQHPFEKSLLFEEWIAREDYQRLNGEVARLQAQYQRGEKVKGQLDDAIRQLKKKERHLRQKYREQVTTRLRKDRKTRYYRLRNCAHVKFGWAMTVHKSMSFKWPEVVFDVAVDEHLGKHSEQYFKWLYTGITRAEERLFLVNYTNMSPFDETKLVDRNSGKMPTEYIFSTPLEPIENLRKAFRHFIELRLAPASISIISVEQFKWQERYSFKKDDKSCVLSFFYNADGEFRFPTFNQGDKALADDLIKLINNKSLDLMLKSIQHPWRRTAYESLISKLMEEGIVVSSIMFKGYRDKIRLNREHETLVTDVDYNLDGAITVITAIYYTDLSLWVSFKQAFDRLRS